QLACFTDGDIARDRLADASGLSPGELSHLLKHLELKSAVRPLPGRRYEKI
ncbi:MAG: DNA processing protein DprA, partial [Alistipes sp.]|nr:DNA processing protein DprA [Alistipes sp.]